MIEEAKTLAGYCPNVCLQDTSTIEASKQSKRSQHGHQNQLHTMFFAHRPCWLQKRERHMSARSGQLDDVTSRHGSYSENRMHLCKL